MITDEGRPPGIARELGPDQTARSPVRYRFKCTLYRYVKLSRYKYNSGTVMQHCPGTVTVTGTVQVQMSGSV